MMTSAKQKTEAGWLKKLKPVLFALTGVCFTITVIDAVQHHAVNMLYACITAADLCISAALGRQDKEQKQ